MSKKRSKGKARKLTVVNFRAPDELVKDLDAYVETLRAETPGGNWSRSAAALNLVAIGLRQVRKNKGAKK